MLELDQSHLVQAQTYSSKLVMSIFFYLIMIWSDCSFQKHFENCSKYPQQCEKCKEEGIKRDKVTILCSNFLCREFYGSIYNPLTYIFLRSCYLSAWHCKEKFCLSHSWEIKSLGVTVTLSWVPLVCLYCLTPVLNGQLKQNHSTKTKNDLSSYFKFVFLSQNEIKLL